MTLPYKEQIISFIISNARGKGKENIGLRAKFVYITLLIFSSAACSFSSFRPK